MLLIDFFAVPNCQYFSIDLLIVTDCSANADIVTSRRSAAAVQEVYRRSAGDLQEICRRSAAGVQKVHRRSTASLLEPLQLLHAD